MVDGFIDNILRLLDQIVTRRRVVVRCLIRFVDKWSRYQAVSQTVCAVESGKIHFVSVLAVFCSFLCFREKCKKLVLLLAHDLHVRGGCRIIRIWIWLRDGEQKEMKTVEQGTHLKRNGEVSRASKVVVGHGVEGIKKQGGSELQSKHVHSFSRSRSPPAGCCVQISK